jgi:hypothetical protein
MNESDYNVTYLYMRDFQWINVAQAAALIDWTQTATVEL